MAEFCFKGEQVGLEGSDIRSLHLHRVDCKFVSAFFVHKSLSVFNHKLFLVAVPLSIEPDIRLHHRGRRQVEFDGAVGFEVTGVVTVFIYQNRTGLHLGLLKHLFANTLWRYLVTIYQVLCLLDDKKHFRMVFAIFCSVKNLPTCMFFAEIDFVNNNFTFDQG